MSTENNSRAPRLRFPGFTGEWEEKKLGEITNDIYQPQTISKEQFTNTGYPVYGANGIIGFYDKYNHETDQILVTCRGASCGTINFSKGKCWITGNAMVVNLDKVISHYNKQFFYYLLENCDLNNIITGSGQPQIVRTPLLNLRILVPPTIAEQKKIAECLAEMDSLIDAQSQNVDALKEEKKGLMQQLFPQDGETSPRRRFAGCSGDWTVNRLGNVCESMLVGFPFKGQDITNDKSGHPILRAYSIGTGCIMHGEGYDKYFPHDAKALEKYMVRSGDIVIAMDGSVGRNIAMVSDAEDGFLLIQRVARLRIKDYPIQLIYQQIISQRFKDFASAEKVGSIISHISQKQIESFPIYLPFSKDEQQKIADCLTALDDQITAESAKLEALKVHKKGLMQQLFPQPAR